MEFTPKPCPAPNCNGTVPLDCFGTEEIIAKGQCDTCGQHYENELLLEPTGELIPVAPETNPEAWK